MREPRGGRGGRLDKLGVAGATAPSLSAMLARIGGGDRDAFHDLYQQTAPALLGASLRILPDRGAAEDALQDVFLAVWQKASVFDEARGSAIAWLLTLTRNRAIDRLRQGRRDQLSMDLDDDQADAAPSPFEQADAARERGRLADCLSVLPVVEQRYLHAAFFAGATYSELARSAALPLPTLKSRIRRALLKLRECLG